MNEIFALSLSEVELLLKQKKLSVTEVIKSCLQRIEATEPKISALLTIEGEHALELAAQMDVEGPDNQKPLWGIPLVIKDAISTRGIRTTAASRILENFIPIYDAFVIQKLKEAGAIIIAKANMDEFAMGSSTENSAFQVTKNPWNLRKVPGGSSGGSAASVSSCQCYGSLGSDTGGSIRQPAAFCGCVGLKPSYGRVSRYGLFAFGSSLDQIGPLARSVEDCARIFSVIAGFDKRDNTSNPIPVDDYLGGLDKNGLQGKKIGVPVKFFAESMDQEVKDACKSALDLARSLGANIIDIELPSPDIASATYYIIAMAEASSNLARYDGIRYGRRATDFTNLEELYVRSRSEGFGEEVKRRIMLGSYVLSSGYYDAYFRKAAQTRRIIHDQYVKVLESCDAIAMPVTPVTAWDLGTHAEDPLQAYLMDAYTLPINLAGLPGISIPVGIGKDSGMPVGMQFVGKVFGEAKLLGLAYALEQYLPGIGMPSFEITDPKFYL